MVYLLFEILLVTNLVNYIFPGNAQKSRQKDKNKPEPFGDEAKLLARLLRGYDKAARPVANASHTITVKVNFALTQILDMVGHNSDIIILLIPDALLWISFELGTLIPFSHL